LIYDKDRNFQPDYPLSL